MAAEHYDIAVIGAGIAGAGVAAELAPHARVALLERESAPGYHTTGRSAALFTKTYGPAVIRALSRASEAFFDAPGEGFADHPLLTPRGTVLCARADQIARLEAELAELGPASRIRRIDAAEARQLCPLLRADYLAAALRDDESRDIDVDALHRGFLRRLAAAGGATRLRAEVTALAPDPAGWRLALREDEITADVVVNAAGAWADEIGAMAGAARIGLQPKRRTAAIVAAPDGVDPARMHMVVDIAEEFYLKPEAGKLLISPADETPSPPCDAQPEEIDVAIAVDRIECAFDLTVRRIEHKWAGLRSFVADKCPVVGFDPQRAGFFWLAGQGGYGIQTAPALSRTAAALVRGARVPSDIADQGVSAEALGPARPGLPA